MDASPLPPIGLRRLRHKKKLAFLAAVRKTGVIRTAARAAGIGRATHYVWLNNDAKYRAAYEEAIDDATDRIEANVVRMATTGIDGPPNLIAAIFMLKARRPQIYRDHYDVRHSGSINVAISPEDEAIAERIISRRLVEQLPPIPQFNGESRG